MSTKFYKTILKFFFLATVLTALSACGGGSSGGDEGVADSDGACSADSTLLICQKPDTVTVICNPATHDCTTGLPLIACDPATHDCTTGKPLVTCDPAIHDCNTGKPLVTCDPLTHDCDTGLPLDTCGDSCKPIVVDTIAVDTIAVDIVKPTQPADVSGVQPPAIPLSPDNDESLYVRATGYTPLDTEAVPDDPATDMPFASWDAALAAVVEDTEDSNSDYTSVEYNATVGAVQMKAAYAYARGYTGEGIIVSSMSTVVDRSHTEFRTLIQADFATYRIRNYLPGSPNLLTGYTADTSIGEDGISHEGTCMGLGCSQIIKGTSFAGVIVATKGDFNMHGIAYNAKLKPIDIFTSAGEIVDGTMRIAAIEAASGIVDAGACASSDDKMIDACKTITVMSNPWSVSGISTLEVSGNTVYYKRSHGLSTISDAEREAWKKAVETTVVVFGQGNYGFNSENGQVPIYADDELTIRTPSGVAGNTFLHWDMIEGSLNRNLGTSHARLPLEVPELQGKWLTAISLDENNRITLSANGCGDAKNWCLGARTTRVNTPTAPHSIVSAGNVPDRTDQYDDRGSEFLAAAHVSGAIAVVASAFPNLTPSQLVSIILESADDIGIPGVDNIYGHGALNLARATEPLGEMDMVAPDGMALGADARIDNSGITLPTSFGGALAGFKAGFTDDYDRAFIGSPSRIAQASASFTLADTLATWESPELQNIALDSNSKMQFTNYDASGDAKDTLIFTHKNANHTIGFSYNEESKNPDLRLAGAAEAGDEMHFQKIRPIASDLMQVNSTHKLGKVWSVKNAITTGAFDTGNRFNEAMANLNYASENRNLTIGAGTLKEYGQFLGASGTGAYQLSDATQSTVTHLAISQNLPKNSSVKVKYTNFKAETDMRYSNFANINDLTADEYQLSLTSRQIFGKSDSLNFELIQPFAVTDGALQQSTVLGYNAEGGYNNVVQNYELTPAKRRQQLRMTWQNQINLERKTKLFISMQYENHVDNVRDNEDSTILGGFSTNF